MWRRRRLGKPRNVDPLPTNTEDGINASLDGDQKSHEPPRLRQWKDRPEAVKQEMPARVFDILQKQHDLSEDEG